MKRVEKIAEAFNEIIDAQIDYEENHKNAGDGYNHLPLEGGWQYNDCDERLAQFIRKNKIDTKGLNTDELAEIVLDNFDMCSYHQFSKRSEINFYIDGCPITEIELQYNLLEICERLSNELLINVTPKRLIKIIKNERTEYYIRDMETSNDDFFVNCPSDMVWQAEISKNKLQKAINDYAAK